jgi:hypothetical protein
MQSSSSRLHVCIFTPTQTTFLYSNSPESAAFNMLLQVLKVVPSSSRNLDGHDAPLHATGHDPTHPIVIDDSDNEGDIGPSAPTARQTRKRTPLSRRGQVNTTKQRNRHRNRGSDLQSKNPSDVFYPDLSDKLPRAENDINAATAAQDVVPMAIRECPVCGDSSPIAEWPSLAGCEHPRGTCSACYAIWITAQLQESSWTEARCPESTCHVKMTYDEIQQYALVDIFRQYDTFITRALLNEDRKFRHSALLTR